MISQHHFKRYRQANPSGVLYTTALFEDWSVSQIGANPFELQIALGHTTLEMTRRYTQALGFEDVFKRHVIASPVDRLIR